MTSGATMRQAAHRADGRRSGSRTVGRTVGRTAGRLVGPGLALTAAVLGSAVGAGLLLRGAVLGTAAWATHPDTRTPTQLVATGCAAVAGLILGWLALGVALSVAEGLPGRAGRRAGRLAVALTPAVVRWVVAATLGGSVALSSLSTGSSSSPDRARPAAAAPRQPAADGPTHVRPDQPGQLAADPDWGWRPPAPGRPATCAPDVGLVSSRPAGRAPDREVVVRRRDTLWSIVARHLGPSATAADIAADWPRWFAVNRHTIGPDPDRLVPGQRLVPPR